MSARDNEIRRVVAELEVQVTEAEASIAVLKALLADDEVPGEENSADTEIPLWSLGDCVNGPVFRSRSAAAWPPSSRPSARSRTPAGIDLSRRPDAL